MRELKTGTYTLDGLVSMGSTARLTLAAGERLTEEQYQAVPQTDRSLFRRVRSETSPVEGVPADPAPEHSTD